MNTYLFEFFLGFVGCAILIWGSKALGRYWLQRDENYYDEGQD